MSADADELLLAEFGAGEFDAVAGDVHQVAAIAARRGARDLVLLAVDDEHQMRPAPRDGDVMDLAVDGQFDRHGQFLQPPIAA